jgi:hypothetical protein
LFQQPAGEVGGELARALFEEVEGRRWRGVGGEEPVKESVGVLKPLLAELFAIGRRRGGHGDTFQEGQQE